MPSLSAAIAANQQRLATQAQTVRPAASRPAAVATTPGVSSRTVLPSRGTYPPNIILATDFENATGMYYGRLRSRTFLSSTHPLLANN